ncbi:MAG: ROK family protein [Ignavibacteriaceae bacterium]|nr:ROK family protein [Ignavibacteriaceae bacterium]
MLNKVLGTDNLKNRLHIGVDFGGTKIMTGAMTGDGKVVGEPIKIPTNSSDEPGKIVKNIIKSIEETLQNIKANVNDVEGIGLGVTGPLDIKNGVILECPQLPTMHFYPLKKTIAEHFPLPVYMNNDANCLIYGEALFGSGMGKNNVVGFTLGTGLGCAIIIDKKIFPGFTESAGEIWTSPYGAGIIEDFISGTGVSNIYKNICGEDRSSLEISVLAENSNANALKTWEQFGRHLAVPLAWTINLIDPELVILGGSIANAYKFFSPSMEENLRKRICPVPAEKTKIVCAELGANAGFIGAAALAIKEC